MRKIVFYIFLLSLISCSASKPKNLTYRFDPTSYTGLNTLIRTDGYYILKPKCDEKGYSMLIFYDNGLYGSSSGYYSFEPYASDERIQARNIVSWGLYEIVGDTIKGQQVEDAGIYGKGITFRELLILPSKEILDIGSYCLPGSIANCPEYEPSKCPEKYIFYPYDNLVDYRECPWIDKKWFLRKNDD